MECKTPGCTTKLVKGKPTYKSGYCYYCKPTKRKKRTGTRKKNSGYGGLVEIEIDCMNHGDGRVHPRRTIAVTQDVIDSGRLPRMRCPLCKAYAQSVEFDGFYTTHTY